MKNSITLMVFFFATTSMACELFAQRGFGGRGGRTMSRPMPSRSMPSRSFGGGGFSPSRGFSAPSRGFSTPPRSFSAPRTLPQRPTTSPQRQIQTRPSFSAGNSGHRTYTGPSGGTVTVGGLGKRVDGSRGSAGIGAGGVRVETAGGRTVTKGGAAGGVRTDKGAAGGIVGGSRRTGPDGGSFTRGGAAGGIRTEKGVAGGVARGSRVTGPSGGSYTKGNSFVAGKNLANGNGLARYSRAGVVRGPGGTVAGHATRAVTRTSRHGTGVAVRRSVAFSTRRGWFGSSWFVGHPGAWRPPNWARATFWTAVSVRSLYGWWGWPTYPVAVGVPVYGAESPPVVYDYGNTIVYEGDQVYYGDQPVATAEEYYDDASEIAEEGRVEHDEQVEWKPLGVFAMVQGEDSEAEKIIQFAVDQEGHLQGNFFDVLTESSLAVQGSVDEQSKRVAWTVGDNDQIVYETGLANLAEDEAPMLVHYGKDQTRQWLLVRLEEPEA